MEWSLPYTFLEKEYESVLILELGHKKSEQTISWVYDNVEKIQKKITKYGGILLRSTALDSVSSFEMISKIICKVLFKYEGGITPRTQLSSFVYTSTDYNKKYKFPSIMSVLIPLNGLIKYYFFVCNLQQKVVKPL